MVRASLKRGHKSSSQIRPHQAPNFMERLHKLNDSMPSSVSSWAPVPDRCLKKRKIETQLFIHNIIDRYNFIFKIKRPYKQRIFASIWFHTDNTKNSKIKQMWKRYILGIHLQKNSWSNTKEKPTLQIKRYLL